MRTCGRQRRAAWACLCETKRACDSMWGYESRWWLVCVLLRRPVCSTGSRALMPGKGQAGRQPHTHQLHLLIHSPLDSRLQPGAVARPEGGAPVGPAAVGRRRRARRRHALAHAPTMQHAARVAAPHSPRVEAGAAAGAAGGSKGGAARLHCQLVVRAVCRVEEAWRGAARQHARLAFRPAPRKLRPPHRAVLAPQREDGVLLGVCRGRRPRQGRGARSACLVCMAAGRHQPNQALQQALLRPIASLPSKLTVDGEVL